MTVPTIGKSGAALAIAALLASSVARAQFEPPPSPGGGGGDGQSAAANTAPTLENVAPVSASLAPGASVILPLPSPSERGRDAEGDALRWAFASVPGQSRFESEAGRASLADDGRSLSFFAASEFEGTVEIPLVLLETDTADPLTSSSSLPVVITVAVPGPEPVAAAPSQGPGPGIGPNPGPAPEPVPAEPDGSESGGADGPSAPADAEPPLEDEPELPPEPQDGEPESEPDVEPGSESGGAPELPPEPNDAEPRPEAESEPSDGGDAGDGTAPPPPPAVEEPDPVPAAPTSPAPPPAPGASDVAEPDAGDGEVGPEAEPGPTPPEAPAEPAAGTDDGAAGPEEPETTPPSQAGATPPAPQDDADDRTMEGFRLVASSEVAIALAWEAPPGTTATLERDGAALATVEGNRYVDTDVIAGQRYVYSLAGEEAAGQVQATAAVRSIGADTRSPLAPGEVLALGRDDGSTVIAWQEGGDDRGVAGYDLYRDGRYFATVYATAYLDVDAPQEIGTLYEVAAFDEARNYSPRSAATFVDGSVPSVGGDEAAVAVTTDARGAFAFAPVNRSGSVIVLLGSGAATSLWPSGAPGGARAGGFVTESETIDVLVLPAFETDAQPSALRLRLQGGEGASSTLVFDPAGMGSSTGDGG